jgi:hypothetical protein
MPHQFNQQAMDYLRLWHLRMGHCSLHTIVAMAEGAANGMDPPANMPSHFDLGPYFERLNCSSCLAVYGFASGPPAE